MILLSKLVNNILLFFVLKNQIVEALEQAEDLILDSLEKMNEDLSSILVSF